MSATSALLWVLALWLAIGVVAGLVMGRRGHDPFEWLLLGAMLGPLALPVAVAITGHPDQAAPRQLAAGRSESTVPHRPRPPLIPPWICSGSSSAGSPWPPSPT
jgi:uncharacterized SAM-binding protein YcdF (DUF218 family)